MHISFRESVLISDFYNVNLGDRLVINQDGIAKNIPLKRSNVEQSNWTSGSCLNVTNKLRDITAMY